LRAREFMKRNRCRPTSLWKREGYFFITTVPGFEPVAGKRMGRRKVDGIVAGIMACSTHLSLTDVSKKIFRYRISMSYRIDAHKKGLMARRLLFVSVKIKRRLIMKRIIMAVLIGVAGFVMLTPSFGYCDPAWRYGHDRGRYVVVREHAPRYNPPPVHYRQRNVYYVERGDDYRGLQIAGAAIGGVILGTVLGSAIAHGR